MNQPANEISKSRMLVSVIMPCHNAKAYVREAVQSVLDQTYRNVELLIVDDGSNDGSLSLLNALAATHPDRIRLYFQDRQGPYPARNLGLQHAKGALVAFLDADDYWRADFIELMVSALEKAGPGLALTYCGWQNIGPNVSSEPYVPPDYELEDKAVRLLRAAAPWPIHAALVRRTVLDEVGGFDLELPTCMDYDLWLRIAVGRPIRLVPHVLAFYRHHQSGQITSKQWRQAKNSWLVKRKFVRENPGQVAHIPRRQLRELIDGGLLRRGYDNFWRRDLDSAQRIFRMSLMKGGWSARDLRYLLPALLPAAVYRKLVRSRDVRTS